MITNELKNKHLMWRAGFGPSADQIKQLNEIPTLLLYNALKKASSKKPQYIDVADDYLKGLVLGIGEESNLQKPKELEPNQKKLFQQKQRDDIKSLNLHWLNEMVNSEAQLREKMAFFWHGHFASRNINIFFQQYLLDVIRQNALGNFSDLLHEVSRSAAMINFLNANQNRKDHPNENFAREVMELFTLGRGHYTETDIKEAARAFTGWGANLKGEFVFRKLQHDEGLKTVLGKTGNFDGDDVLDIILEQKQTANFIVQKVYRFFVNDTLNPQHVNWLSERFYNNKYDISKLMDDIFTSQWFYDENNIGVKIKSPIELIVGIRRMLPMELQKEESLLQLQRILGQVLFYPPNVAGWPGGRSWIDSSTLMMRMRIAQLIYNEDEFNIHPKTDDDQMMGRMEDHTITKNKAAAGQFHQLIKADIDWQPFLINFKSIPRDQLIDSMCNNLLQIQSVFKHEILNNYADISDREKFIKSVTVQIMSTPEYQMC